MRELKRWPVLTRDERRQRLELVAGWVNHWRGGALSEVCRPYLLVTAWVPMWLLREAAEALKESEEVLPSPRALLERAVEVVDAKNQFLELQRNGNWAEPDWYWRTRRIFLQSPKKKRKLKRARLKDLQPSTLEALRELRPFKVCR